MDGEVRFDMDRGKMLTTAQTGWMRSGDIALVDEKGRFKIIDRCVATASADAS